MRYFITLSYDGSDFCGWQVQPGGRSVQGELQRCLSLLLRHEVGVTGAGRTDAGVHALKMVAHFDEPSPIDHRQLAYRLGRVLPRDMAVSQISPVADTLHARFSAYSRTYYYFVHTRRDPFLRHSSCFVPYALDFALMNEAAQRLLAYTDFAAFCKSHSDVKTTLCTMTEARWEQTGEYRWQFTITANRFLRNMVRAVVGTLVEVGRHRLTVDDFCRVVEGGKRMAAGESMPAHALFLADIRYPEAQED